MESVLNVVHFNGNCLLLQYSTCWHLSVVKYCFLMTKASNIIVFFNNKLRYVVLHRIHIQFCFQFCQRSNYTRCRMKSEGSPPSSLLTVKQTSCLLVTIVFFPRQVECYNSHERSIIKNSVFIHTRTLTIFHQSPAVTQ